MAISLRGSATSPLLETVKEIHCLKVLVAAKTSLGSPETGSIAVTRRSARD